MENKDKKDYKQQDDETLTRLVQQGDKLAFDALLERYHLYLKKYLLKLIADPDAADDILQDTFIKVYTSIHQYRGEASFKNWLFVVTRNSWKNYLRSHQYQTRIDRIKDVYDRDIASEHSPENALIQQQQSKLLRIAISTLPTKQRTTLSLRIGRQLPFSHIADAMHCSLSTAKANHYSGVKTVGRMLAA